MIFIVGWNVIRRNGINNLVMVNWFVIKKGSVISFIFDFELVVLIRGISISEIEMVIRFIVIVIVIRNEFIDIFV